MKLRYWESPEGNFGDDLNLWLWDFLLPGWESWDRERYLFGVGTILYQEAIPEDVPILVVGSGVGYGTLPELKPSKTCDIRCVRGAGSARRLGLPEEFAVVDPAVMVCRMPEFQGLESSGETLFVPHWQSAVNPGYDWKAICAKAGVTFLHPCGPSKEIIRQLARARLVITESMHAAIIADAFRVPWIPVHLNDSFNGFKWNDWGERIGVQVEVYDLYSMEKKRCQSNEQDAKPHSAAPSADTFSFRLFVQLLMRKIDFMGIARSLRNVLRNRILSRNLGRIKSVAPTLSDQALLNARMDRFEHLLEEIKNDYA